MTADMGKALVSPDVVYVGNFQFPDGDAAAGRVLGIGRALRESGFHPAFVGVEKCGRAQDRGNGNVYCYQGFPYIVAEGGAGLAHRCRRAWQVYLSGSSTISRLQQLDMRNVRAVVAYNATSPLLWRLISLCRARRIALIADSTEWYDHAQVMGGQFGVLRWDTELRMRWLHPRVGAIIAISQFLADYYRNCGCRALRVPPLVDTEQSVWRPSDVPCSDEGPLRLVYAGSPGRKDLLGNILQAVHHLRSGGAHITLDLVGPSREAIAACVDGQTGVLTALGDSLICHGRVPREHAIRIVSSSHFSVLLRPNKRYAHAGFPTKLVESLAAGVPTIVNATSDIAEYVHDCREGIVLGESTTEACVAGLRRILELPRPKWRAMREDARQRAVKSFDYRGHVDSLKRFALETIRGVHDDE